MKKLSLLCAVCATLLLSACHSSSSSNNGSPTDGSVPTPPSTMVDAFYTMVTQYFSPTSEDTDATPIDEVVATQPEDTEPVEFT
ncbi:hypothetical protein [Massilia sp. TWP1-3-3]|uniref:hypothetical protein n=1 Tax=Massilia sp. TWP1-3-3 TaxID=2804573 RepID=UPI003CF3220A